MVCMDASPQSQNLVRRGWRMANRYRTELLAVFIETPRWASAAPEQKRALEENLRFAEDLGAEPIRVQSSDVARALMQVPHEKRGQHHHRPLTRGGHQQAQTVTRLSMASPAVQSRS